MYHMPNKNTVHCTITVIALNDGNNEMVMHTELVLTLQAPKTADP